MRFDQKNIKISFSNIPVMQIGTKTLENILSGHGRVKTYRFRISSF